MFDWHYALQSLASRRLYQRAVDLQWHGARDLDWSVDVDPELASVPESHFQLAQADVYRKLTRRERVRLRVESGRYTVSQLLHGEQGALIAAAQLVDTLPQLDAKFFAASQVVDEARHVEVFERYLKEKLGAAFPVSDTLRTMLETVVGDSRWDFKVLGMQVMVEGLALANLGSIRDVSREPLLKELATLVMRDEARHVSFSVLALRDLYPAMQQKERAEREDFVYELARLMYRLPLAEPLWEHLELPVAACVELTRLNPHQRRFRRILSSTLSRTLEKVGLLGPRQRARLDALAAPM